MHLRIDVLTIFPEYLQPLRHALLGKAIEDGIVSVGVHDLRDWATGAHRAVDDSPAGGGPGMVMMPQVWGPALDAVCCAGSGGGLAADGPSDGSPASDGRTSEGLAGGGVITDNPSALGLFGDDLVSAVPHTGGARHDELNGVEPQPYEAREVDERPLLIVPTPAGRPFTQADARAWSREHHNVFACGRYEGIDERVFIDAAHRYRVEEVSIGDYVLIGGEVAALVMSEAIVRLIPGVLGNQQSHQEDSFSDGLLEGPCYTRPREWRGLAVSRLGGFCHRTYLSAIAAMTGAISASLFSVVTVMLTRPGARTLIASRRAPAFFTSARTRLRAFPVIADAASPPAPRTGASTVTVTSCP